MLPPPRAPARGSAHSSSPSSHNVGGAHGHAHAQPHHAHASTSSHSLAPPKATNNASWSDLDDDDGWQDMPVVRSNDFTSELDAVDDKKFHYRAPIRLDNEDEHGPTANATGVHLELEADTLITDSWREKAGIDESEYTRLRLEEDNESEEVHMRTRFLFDEDKAMTPLSQMQATKQLLTEGQRIAYVGLCALIARRMLADMGRGWEGYKAKQHMLKGKGRAHDVPVVESGNIWMIKIMARLYQHMELERDEQRMIESLAEHGVDPADLVPALMTTHTVKNPEFDPAAKKAAEAEAYEAAQRAEVEAEVKMVEAAEAKKKAEADGEAAENDEGEPAPTNEPAPAYEDAVAAGASPPPLAEPTPRAAPRKMPSLFDDDDEEEVANKAPPSRSEPRKMPSLFDDDEGDVVVSKEAPAARSEPRKMPSLFDDDEDGGDIGGSAPSPRKPVTAVEEEDDGDIGAALTSPEPGRGAEAKLPATPAPDASSPPLPAAPPALPPKDDDGATPQQPDAEALPDAEAVPDADADAEAHVDAPMPALPGVSTSITAADEDVTLDIRWTVLCDLFLVLVADSVYDARSRAFLERVAKALGFEWLDVVRFENRVTDTLEIQENVGQLQQVDVIESRRKGARNKRYAMMGAAAVGGALVIGLSAGLLAPFIGAGIGAALGTVGIGGTTAFLGGAGGAAIITTTGVVTGGNIAGRGMARRTREVRTFELKPLHNNKRVSCYITVGGFMASKVDDVRLPFSVLDAIVGDVLSVLWEPEMMNEMGNAIKILSTEVLTQVGQTILQATVMTALMSALQWPLLLTKLGYLIDNPWSNALDRAKAAGLVLADVLIQRHAGVRPTSLIGFSLGARVIFYALCELARVKAYGIVQDVYLFGTTVTASRQTWLGVRSVVGGRFVNAYASSDWMLGYLFRATSGGLNTVAGLRPVEDVPGLENVDCTEFITGHMSYRSAMPMLLAHVGFPVTQEWFDEPDDPDADPEEQERYVVNEEEEEEARRSAEKKILGIFPRSRKSGSRSGSGASTPVPRASTSKNATPSKNAGDDDDDELPPREEAASPVELEADIGERASTALSPEQAAAVAAAAAAEEERLAAIPKTAGFDFAAISQALGKEIDVDKLKDPSRDAPAAAAHVAALERTGSAPPLAPRSPSASADRSPPLRSQSAAGGLPVDDAGDIAVTANKALTIDMPEWGDGQVPTPGSTGSAGGGVWANVPSSPPKKASSSLFGFTNAWATPASTSPAPPPSTGSFNSDGLRAAPPARPHPAEFTNPFASSAFMSPFGAEDPLGAPPAAAGSREREKWGKEVDRAMENPW